jgi:uncharacterized protein (TIGR03437 family)
VICKLRVAADPAPGQILITSTSQQVKTPAAVLPRANQTSLMFQVSADAAARGQLATIAATAGSTAVQDTIQVMSASGPILTVPGRQVAKRGEPVRFLVTATDPAGLPVQLKAPNLPAGASFDVASGSFDWTPAAAQSGKYQVTFTATNEARQSSSAQLAIDVSSGDPTLESAPQACSPGAVALLMGSWLAEPGPVFSDPSGQSMDLDGTKVKINGQYVPVLFASSTQVRFLCPVMDPGTRLQVAVETASGVTGSGSTVMESAAPRIFSLQDSGENQGLVSFAGSTELAMSRNPERPAHPAQPGDELVIWGSGFGLPAQASTRTVSVQLGDVDAEVESIDAVPGYAGVYAVRVRVPIPLTYGETVPLQLKVISPDGKQFNSNSVAIAVEPAAL